ncbi:MAG: HAD-IB family hydrolase [Hydrogenophilus sp.]|nr:HAD-IB family hydrolase [Hydrogenophilus sp.]
MNAMELTLFDLDNTLIAGDSDYEWANFLARHGLVDPIEHEAKNRVFYQDYLAGTLDIHAFLRFQLAPLARYERSMLEALRASFLAELFPRLFLPKAREAVAQAQARGDLVAIVTATNSFVTGPIARYYGVEHLIATIPAVEHGRFTGLWRGTPAFQAGKIERVELWLESLGYWWSSFTTVRFYTDSHNDLPLLERVDEPMVVDPDPTLAVVARRRGWPILSFRG